MVPAEAFLYPLWKCVWFFIPPHKWKIYLAEQGHANKPTRVNQSLCCKAYSEDAEDAPPQTLLNALWRVSVQLFFFFKEMAFPSCSIMHPGSIFLFQYSALSVYNLRAVSQLLIYFLKITFILSHDFITFFIPFSLLGSSTLWKWWTLFY